MSNINQRSLKTPLMDYNKMLLILIGIIFCIFVWNHKLNLCIFDNINLVCNLKIPHLITEIIMNEKL